MDGHEEGWPREFGTHLDGAYVGVARSELRFECQRCRTNAVLDATAGSDVSYVRVCLDLLVEQDGTQHIRHVEELFPCFIMEVLHMQLDEHVAARVRRTIMETLVSLNEEEPVENLLQNMIAPMRLYEPLLNALLAPPEQDSMAAWLDTHIKDFLCTQDDTLAEVTINGCHVRLKASDVAIQNNLRASGEVKVLGHVEVCCAQTGQKKGEWKSRAVLMPPSLRTRELPEPDESCQQRFQALTDVWRKRLEENLSEHLSDGVGRFRLSEVLPELPLCQEELAEK